MKKSKSLHVSVGTICSPLLLLLLILSPLAMNGQSPADFSGKWLFDISKSDAGEGSSFGSGDMTRIILQTPASISIEEISGVQSIGVRIFKLDGKETTEKTDSRTIIRSAAWSQDKKNLTLTEKMIIDSENYSTDDKYQLSDNGLVLTVRSVAKGPNFELPSTLVFNKKKN